MKKRLLLLTFLVCVLFAFGSASVSASVFAEDLSTEFSGVDSIGSNGMYSIVSVESDSDFSVLSEAGVSPSAATPSATFYDLSSSHWAFSYISFMVETGVMSGKGNGIFAPDTSMTRAEVAQVIYNMNGKPAMSYQGTFYDVAYGQWYTPAVEWAAANGIVNGTGNGLYSPNKEISRQDFLTMLYRYSNKVGYGTSTFFKLDAFVDKSSVADYAKDAFGWGVACGIISGNPVNGQLYLQPTAFATRAQISKMMTVFLKQYVYVPYSMVIGDQVDLLSEVLPGDLYKKLTWSSLDSSVATVSSSGVVRGVSQGKTAIYGRLSNGAAVTLTIYVTGTPYDAVASFLKSEGAMSYSGNGETIYKLNISENISGNLFNYGVQYIVAANGADQIQFFVKETASGAAEYTTTLKMTRNSSACSIYINYNEYGRVTAYGEDVIYPESYSTSTSVYLDKFTVSDAGYNSEQNKLYMSSLLKQAVDQSLEIADDMYFYGNTGVTVKDLGFNNF